MFKHKFRSLPQSHFTLHPAVKFVGRVLVTVVRLVVYGTFSLFRFHGVDPGKLDGYWQ